MEEVSRDEFGSKQRYRKGTVLLRAMLATFSSRLVFSACVLILKSAAHITQVRLAIWIRG